MRRALLALALLVATAPLLLAQQQTGEIFGRVTDNTGAVLPGATVTISGTGLLQPRMLTTSETGSYRAPDLPIGTYDVKFELTGFRTVVKSGIRVNIGFSAQVNGELEISAVEETITVSGESPIIDTKSTTAKTTFDYETLQAIPSARDPWVMLERTPGITMDRANIGGTQSGQQSGYVSRGAGTFQNKWSIDGVDITDMSATGASPIYYDFDMLEEMQVTTGGADVSQQTSGVGINFVTRSGTDRFKGSGRYYITDEEFQSDNVDDEIRAQGAGSGNPIQNIKDYGFEVGGPIKKGKLWYWGSYGKQDVKVGVLGFFKNTPTCRPAGVAVGDIARVLDTDTLRGCLETDLTTLNNYNYKLQWSPFQGNQFTFQNTWAEKVRNARDAADTRPIETTFRQKAVGSEFGRFGWLTGPSPFWKLSDQHVITDRWLVEAMWSHLGNNFVLDFHEDSLADVQPRFEISTGAWSRSYRRSGPFIRPTNSFDLTTNYFLPAVAGGDHALKAGFRWRSALGHAEEHRGGNTEARFLNGVASEAELFRDSVTRYDLQTYAFFLQDTYTLNRLNINVGFRFDRQVDLALASTVPAHPFAPQWLPSITFEGADPGVIWNDFSPRAGLTFDMFGTGKTVAKTSYAIYYGQLAPGSLSGVLNPVTSASVRFPWADRNGDTVVQADELNYSSILTFTGNYNPDNPTFLGTTNTVDPNIKNERTREFIAGIDHEIMTNFAVGASYIWRKYDQFRWDDRVGIESDDWVARTFTPPASSCPAGARCETVTYYEPVFALPALQTRTNVPDRDRMYNGFELTASKRMANRWSANLSYAFNNAVDRYLSGASYEDPTCRGGGSTDGFLAAIPSNAVCAAAGEMQFAPESAGSGIDNIFTNAKWLVKASGVYQAPLSVNVAGNLNVRQGYPFPAAVRIASRANRAGLVDVLLEPIGDVRHPNFYNFDMRIDRAFGLGRGVRIIPSLDIFNITNVNTVLARRRFQAANNANQISGIIAPRVIRFGMRLQW